MPEVKRYVLVSKSTGFIENVILWDGESDWEPDAGFDVLLEKDALEQGVTWKQDVPVVSEEQSQEPEDTDTDLEEGPTNV
jgi:hypothetical protein